MILIKTLKLNNFLSHEDSTITFKENEKILLDGKSGSGKSSITEALLFCLYGKGRSDNRSLVRRGQKTASVSLKLTDGLKETIITRNISTSGKNTLSVTQNTGSSNQFIAIERVGIKDIQDWIENDLLKASYELFTNSIAYPQENENSFVKANASRRKDLLLEIVHAGSFDQLYDKTRRAITSNELDNAVTSSKVETIENTIKVSQEIASKYDTYKFEVAQADEQISFWTTKEKELETQSNNISGIVRQLNDKKVLASTITGIIKNIDLQLENNQKTILYYKTLDIETAKKNIEEADKLSIQVEEIEKKIKENVTAQQKINAHLANKPTVIDYSKDIELINQRLVPLLKESGSCPAGDACPFVIPIKGQIEFLKSQITDKNTKTLFEKKLLEKWEKEYVELVPTVDTSELYKQLDEIKEKVKVLSKSKEVILKHQLFEQELIQIQTREVKLKEDRVKSCNDIILLDTEIKDLGMTLFNSDSNKINSDLSTTRILLQDLKKTRDKAALGLGMASNAIQYIQQESVDLLELQKVVKKAQEDKESLELLKEALSPRGIKAVVIDYLVPTLEEKINTVLAQMSDFRIRLDTQQALVGDEGVKEGLFITVLNDQKEELPFESYSGGEKVKITIAISEALASLLNQSIGFRLMDENIVSLDKESTEGFVIVLTKLQESFPQLMVISHLQEVKDLFEKQLMVTKINGVSKIQ